MGLLVSLEVTKYVKMVTRLNIMGSVQQFVSHFMKRLEVLMHGAQVFSAPKYCDQGTNKGAFIRIDEEGTQSFFQFEAKPHPPLKPMAYAGPGMQFMGL
jgi:hypothetical protein